MTKNTMIKVLVERFNEYFEAFEHYRKRIEAGDDSKIVKRLYETNLSMYVAIADVLDRLEIDVYKYQCGHHQPVGYEGRKGKIQNV